MAKKILVVDDSALMRRVACDIIASDSRFLVEDIARDGLQALELLKAKSYDAVVLDVNMPKMDGLKLLRELQKQGIRANVMMFSTMTSEGARETIEALELGALDFIQKPDNVVAAGKENFKKDFLRMLNIVSLSRNGRPLRRREDMKTGRTPIERTPVLRPSMKVSGKKIVAIASSTGGPKALQQVIPKLPPDLNAPVILVQHMPAGFTKSLADRLNGLSRLNVKEAEEGDLVQKGWVYIAAGGKHMKVARSGSNVRIYYSDEPAREGVKPCANYMYESLMESGYDEISCVVLTGMGADGTEGIKNLETKKKVHVIAQDESTCAVYGMPKSIVATGLVNEIVPIEKVADAITKDVGVS